MDGMKIGTAIMQNSGEVPQKTNNRNRNAIAGSKPAAGTEVGVPDTALTRSLQQHPPEPECPWMGEWIENMVCTHT